MIDCNDRPAIGESLFPLPFQLAFDVQANAADRNEQKQGAQAELLVEDHNV